MKLLKAFAACFLSLFLFVSVTGCNSDFCSDEERTAIKTELRTMVDTGVGTGDYATPEDWASKSEEDKTTYVNDLFTNKHPKACLTFTDDTDLVTGVAISAKDFSFAISQGFFDGFLTYPFGFLMDKFARAIGLNGWGQLIAIAVVTIVVRFVIVLVTWKPTMASQRMQMLQPEMAEITAKYGNTKDPAMKQKQAQETMALYKKHKINPITSLIVPFITLPIFIGVYGAVRATLVLKEGAIFGLNLAQTLSSGVLAFHWLAILIFLLMIVTQFLSMKLPELLNRKKLEKLDSKTRKANNQTQTFSYVMLIMVVVIGWMLPISMSVYWVTSSLFTCFQTIVTKKITDKQKRKEREREVY